MSKLNVQIAKYNSPLDETNYYDPFLLVKSAKGIYIWMEGKKEPYIDLLMGYSSTNFGHVNPDIARIVEESVHKFDNITSFNSKDKIEESQGRRRFCEKRRRLKTKLPSDKLPIGNKRRKKRINIPIRPSDR